MSVLFLWLLLLLLLSLSILLLPPLLLIIIFIPDFSWSLRGWTLLLRGAGTMCETTESVSMQ